MKPIKFIGLFVWLFSYLGGMAQDTWQDDYNGYTRLNVKAFPIQTDSLYGYDFVAIATSQEGNILGTFSYLNSGAEQKIYANQEIYIGPGSTISGNIHLKIKTLALPTTFGTNPDPESLVIYELVTPNQDNYNDYFWIENIDLFPENELIIYNQWGKVVHRAKDYSNTWTCENLNNGSYFYELRLKEYSKVLKGGFLVLK